MSTIKNEYTYREFLDYCKNTPRHSSHTAKNSNDTGSSFSGTASLEAAFELAYEGWDAGLKQLELEDGVAVTGGVEFMPNVCGAVVNIGAYLSGLPDCMYEVTEKREYNLDPLTVYIPISFNANVDVDKAMSYCMTINKLVNKWQSQYNVKLVVVFDIQIRAGLTVTNVVVKDFDQRFVLNNVAFAFHPSFLRRIWFKWLETRRREDFCQATYGRANNADQIKSRMEKEMQTAEMKLSGKTILIPQVNSTNNGKFEEDQLTIWN